MRNAQSKVKGVIIRRVRGALPSWLLVNVAILGLLTTNPAIGTNLHPAATGYGQLVAGRWQRR